MSFIHTYKGGYLLALIAVGAACSLAPLLPGDPGWIRGQFVVISVAYVSVLFLFNLAAWAGMSLGKRGAFLFETALSACRIIVDGFILLMLAQTSCVNRGYSLFDSLSSGSSAMIIPMLLSSPWVASVTDPLKKIWEFLPHVVAAAALALEAVYFKTLRRESLKVASR